MIPERKAPEGGREGGRRNEGEEQGDEERENETILHPNGLRHSQIPIISQEAASPIHCVTSAASGHTTLWIATNFFVTTCTYSMLTETCCSSSIIRPSFLVANHKLAHRATKKFGVTGFEVASRGDRLQEVLADCRFCLVSSFGVLGLRVKSWILRF